MKNPFKSKKKTSVDTAVMRVIEDDDLPETAKQSILRAVLRDNNISDELMQGMIEGIVPKFDRMFRYGEKNYPLGLPNVTMLSERAGEAVVKRVIEAEQNRTIRMEYFYFGPISVSHYAREYLAKHYGYDSQTNEIKTLSTKHKTPVYLKDITALYTQATVDAADPDTLASWGPPASGGVSPSKPLNNLVGHFSAQTPYEIVPGRNQDGIRVEYEWNTSAGVRQASLTLNLSAAVIESDYFQVQYSWLARGVRHYRYWTYLQGSGKYASIEQIHNPDYSGKGTYFPFIFFRSNKENMTHKNKEGTALYKASAKMMDMMGMDYAQLGSEIHKNEGVGDIEQAVLWMGVPLQSKDPESMKYLFHYFRKLFFMRPSWSRGRIGANIRDRDFSINMSFQDIRYRRYPGKITGVGKYVRTERSSSRQEVAREWRNMSQEGEEGTLYRVVSIMRTIRTRQMVWQYQESASHYAEVVVDDPRMIYEIWRGHNVSADYKDSRFLVPLDKSVTDTFSMSERENLYGKSLHFVFNSRVTQKVRWYQRSWFKTVLVIAAVVITIYTAGASWEAIVAAYAVGGVTAALLVVALELVTAFAIQEGFKLFVKEVGIEAAFYLAIIAAVYTAGASLKNGSIKGAPWASELLAAANGIGNAIQSLQAKLFAGLEQDYLNLLGEQETQLDELEKARSLLDVNGLIDPFEFIRPSPTFVPGETPNEFYTRTVHSGNSGALAIEASLNFTNYALTLPRPSDTLGELL